jgi:hypothetical protein
MLTSLHAIEHASQFKGATKFIGVKRASPRSLNEPSCVFDAHLPGPIAYHSAEYASKVLDRPKTALRGNPSDGPVAWRLHLQR